MQQRTHLEDVNNDETVTKGADYKRSGHLEDIFTDTGAIEHNKRFNPNTTGTDTCLNTCTINKQEQNMPDQKIKGMVLIVILLMIGRTMKRICGP